jgi:hypothetical protein
VLYFWRPPWWGPRWYRDRRDEVRLETALAFSALDGPNEILIIREPELRAARADDGTLVVDADGGRLWFRVRNADRAARRIERTLTP